LPPGGYVRLAEQGTRRIAVSAVQSSSGLPAQLKAISEIAGRSNAGLLTYCKDRIVVDPKEILP
jgi:hypothetical protein